MLRHLLIASALVLGALVTLAPSHAAACERCGPHMWASHSDCGPMYMDPRPLYFHAVAMPNCPEHHATCDLSGHVYAEPSCCAHMAAAKSCPTKMWGAPMHSDGGCPMHAARHCEGHLDAAMNVDRGCEMHSAMHCASHEKCEAREHHRSCSSDHAEMHERRCASEPWTHYTATVACPPSPWCGGNGAYHYDCYSRWDGDHYTINYSVR